MSIVVVHYDEIGLKGDNRPYFERKLKENIEIALKGISFKIERLRGRIVLRFTKMDEKKIMERLSRVFGIASFSFGFETNLDLKDIAKETTKKLKTKKFSTFAVRTKRANKQFKHTSNDVNRFIGAEIVKMNKNVNLTDPDLTVYIELVDKIALIYFDKIQGPGGLPVGVSGKGICLLSGGIDSPVAAYKMLSRGLHLDYVHFHSYPITKKESINKAKKLFKLLSEYQPHAKLYLVPFADIQKQIVSETLDSYRIILYRRFMFKVAEEIAKKTKAKTLITGESLAQVASQTVENMISIQDAVNMIIMRPLLGSSKRNIISKAEEIETFNISIEPHEDCCSLFVPKHPEIKSDLMKVREMESFVDVDKLVQDAVKRSEII